MLLNPKLVALTSTFIIIVAKEFNRVFTSIILLSLTVGNLSMGHTIRMFIRMPIINTRIIINFKNA